MAVEYSELLVAEGEVAVTKLAGQVALGWRVHTAYNSIHFLLVKGDAVEFPAPSPERAVPTPPTGPKRA